MYENPWLSFCLAPTTVQLAIYSLLVDFMPHKDEDLYSYLSDSYLNSNDVSFSVAHFHNPNCQSCVEKQAYSVVVNFAPNSVQTMLPSIYLYCNSGIVEKACCSSPQSQCQKCWKFGHGKPGCKADHPTCPFCSLQHTKAKHRCPNPSCLKEGNCKPILNCCLVSAAKCPNYGESHSARSRDCPEHFPSTLSW